MNGRTQHGTPAGYRWHTRYRILPVCEPCREARRADAAARRQLRKVIGLLADAARDAGWY
jgi:hypothetical protein